MSKTPNTQKPDPGVGTPNKNESGKDHKGWIINPDVLKKVAEAEKKRKLAHPLQNTRVDCTKVDYPSSWTGSRAKTVLAHYDATAKRWVLDPSQIPDGLVVYKVNADEHHIVFVNESRPDDHSGDLPSADDSSPFAFKFSIVTVGSALAMIVGAAIMMA